VSWRGAGILLMGFVFACGGPFAFGPALFLLPIVFCFFFPTDVSVRFFLTVFSTFLPSLITPFPFVLDLLSLRLTLLSTAISSPFPSLCLTPLFRDFSPFVMMMVTKHIIRRHIHDLIMLKYQLVRRVLSLKGICGT